MTERVPPTVEAGDLIHAILGCEWGRSVWTDDDRTPCSEKAAQIVVLHDGPRERGIKLCAQHRDRVLAETTPHEAVVT